MPEKLRSWNLHFNFNILYYIKPTNFAIGTVSTKDYKLLSYLNLVVLFVLFHGLLIEIHIHALPKQPFY